jgi:nitronate monooxygenase
MVVSSTMDDIVLTRALTGIPASWLGPSLEGAGLDLSQLPEHLSPEQARERFGADASGTQPARWADIWSAGHSCAGVNDVPTVATLVARLRSEYEQARDDTVRLVA